MWWDLTVWTSPGVGKGYYPQNLSILFCLPTICHLPSTSRGAFNVIVDWQVTSWKLHLSLLISLTWSELTLSSPAAFQDRSSWWGWLLAKAALWSWWKPSSCYTFRLCYALGKYHALSTLARFPSHWHFYHRIAGMVWQVACLCLLISWQ